MKILITTDWYVPAVNGVVTSVLNLRRELTARGHEVRVLTLSQSPRSFEQAGVTYLGSIPAGLVYPGARLRVAPAEELIRKLIAWGPDIVHSQCEFSTFPLARHIADTLDVPLVHTYHTVYENYIHYFSLNAKWGRKVVASLTRLVANRTDCLVAPTQKVAELLRGYGVRSPIRVVPTGIDLRRFQAAAVPTRQTELRRELHIPEGTAVLLSVGRLAEEKNLSELLRYLVSEPSAVLLLVGDGPCRESLERQARDLGIEACVIFAGMAAPERVTDYYHLGNLFVSASTSETQGLTYIEALAAGLPALCRADHCLDGVITDGVNGWQYRDEAEFHRNLAAFLEQPELRQSMSIQARWSAEQFSAPTFAEKIEAVYREQLGLHEQSAEWAAMRDNYQPEGPQTAASRRSMPEHSLTQM